MSLNITSVRFTPYNKGALKGFADVELDNSLIIKGFKVFDGKSGLFVANPSNPTADKKYADNIFFTSGDEGELAKKQLSEAILNAFGGQSNTVNQADNSRQARASSNSIDLLGAPPL